ncbi:MAG: CRISPR-associated endonuclease Cas2 [Desulfovibrionaceae bacterium]|nr:CRISPR-associated endonuclease Cas2 [Desulfovibrionaceae bacterium]
MTEELYLVLYDIADSKRLAKAASIVLDYGIRIQKSLYEVHLTEQSLATLKHRLSKIIDKDEDGVKIFPLCASCAVRRMSAGAALPQLVSTPAWLVL